MATDKPISCKLLQPVISTHGGRRERSQGGRLTQGGRLVEDAARLKGLCRSHPLGPSSIPSSRVSLLLLPLFRSEMGSCRGRDWNRVRCFASLTRPTSERSAASHSSTPLSPAHHRKAPMTPPARRSSWRSEGGAGKSGRQRGAATASVQRYSRGP
jgi:hypothetical protein